MACVHSLLLVPAAEEKARGRKRERRGGENPEGGQSNQIVAMARLWSGNKVREYGFT